MEAKEWTVTIHITEDDTHTHARAVLSALDQTTVTGIGSARRNPADRPAPRIGEELAVGRALADLANRLRSIAADDVAQSADPA